MASKIVLDMQRFSEEPIVVSVENNIISICNKETDATFWQVNISLADWDEIKKFVNDRLIQQP